MNSVVVRETRVSTGDLSRAREGMLRFSEDVLNGCSRCATFTGSVFMKQKTVALTKLHDSLLYTAGNRSGGNQTALALLGDLVQSLTSQNKAQHTPYSRQKKTRITLNKVFELALI